MKPVRCDLHIHSCLSPCGEDEMTVNNIVNMAQLLGLELIALTDHNSCKNCRAFMAAAAGKGINAIPGMEITTSEEIHAVCLFPSLQSAMEFDRFVYDRLPYIKNDASIFGDQLILDEHDNITGSETRLLTNATSIGLLELPGLVSAYGGLCFPAHVDRPSFSALSVLGTIPPECGFGAIEVYEPETFFSNPANAKYRSDYNIITGSDAHSLAQMVDKAHIINLPHADFSGLESVLKRKA